MVMKMSACSNNLEKRIHRLNNMRCGLEITATYIHTLYVFSIIFKRLFTIICDMVFKWLLTNPITTTDHTGMIAYTSAPLRLHAVISIYVIAITHLPRNRITCAIYRKTGLSLFDLYEMYALSVPTHTIRIIHESHNH